MSVEVVLRLGGRPLAVRLEGDERGYRAAVDGVTHRLAALVAGPRAAGARGATVEEVSLEIDGRPRRALVARSRNRVLVALAGRVYAFEAGEAARGGAGPAPSGTVVAPMPGKIVAVLVAVGDAIEAGQPLVILEAMKMETPLTASVGGRVRTVAAVVGATVDGGAVLVEIEPAA